MTFKKYTIPHFSVGIDTEMIDRFEGLSLESDKCFLERIFTPPELVYCFSKTNPPPCLCGRFCAKEAIMKAFYSLGLSNVFLNEIEVTSNHVTGPHAEIIKGGISPDILKRIEIKVSVSHTYLTAVSSALVILWCDE